MNIEIEYCVKWNYKPEFDRVSKIIKSINSDVIIIGNRFSPRSGAFEVILNGETVYSKFSTNTFPKRKDINSWFISWFT